MSWRTVVVTGCAKLDYKMDYLVVRKADHTNRIHLSEIGLLMVESTAVSLTAVLLCELTKRKIKVVFCDEQHNPHSELLPYYGSHDTSIKVKKQIQWNQQTKEMVWTEIVSEKIRGTQTGDDKYGKGKENQYHNHLQKFPAEEDQSVFYSIIHRWSSPLLSAKHRFPPRFSPARRTLL